MEKSKTNKKSKSLIVMLVAILLCIAVVLGMGGFTYAKYISSKEVSTQTANVAKWGWKVGLDATDFFGTAYSDTDGDSSTQQVPVAVDYTGKIGVQAGDDATDYIVAPGTQCGQAMTFYIDGSAEVRSQITFTASGDSTVQLLDKDNKAVYEPIKWQLAKGSSSGNEKDAIWYTVTESDDTATYAIVDSNTTGAKSSLTGVSSSETDLGGMTYADLMGVLGVIGDSENAIVEVGSTDGFKYAGYYKLSWAWEFENTNDTTAATNNLYDTILGAIMAVDSSCTEANPYETIGGSGDSEGTQIRIYYVSTTDSDGTTGSKLVIQSLAAGESWTTTGDDGTVSANSNIVTYTATTAVKFGLSITVQQIQGTKATTQD